MRGHSIILTFNYSKLPKVNWSPEKIIALAPDTITGERGKEMAVARKWVTIETNEKILWGSCKASRGDVLYQTVIDPNQTSFSCNCPSQKVPCKHIIGLFLLYQQDVHAFWPNEEIPNWVAKWLSGQQLLPSAAPSKILTEEMLHKRARAKDKRRSERLTLMAQGVADLEVWLSDIIRQGMATTEKQSYSFWQDISARMVDTKLGGLGPRIRSLQLLPTTYTNWPERMLEELADLYLIVSGFKQLENLPVSLQDQLLRIAGVNAKKSDVLIQEGILDEWGVIGEFEGINIDNAGFRRTWLRGKTTRKIGLILEYNYQNQGYQTHWKVGHIYEGELVYYPATYPLRALIKEPQSTGARISNLKGYSTAELFRTDYAEALALHPWLPEFPCCIEQVIPVKEQEELILVDQEKKIIPVHVKEANVWKVLAVSGGHPITVFGEWTGDVFVLLSMVGDGRFVVV